VPRWHLVIKARVVRTMISNPATGSVVASPGDPVLCKISRLDVGEPTFFSLGGRSFERQLVNRAAGGRKIHRGSMSAVSTTFVGGVLIARRHRLQAPPGGRHRQCRISCRGMTTSAPNAAYAESLGFLGTDYIGLSEELHMDVVHFGSAIYYVSENDGILDVEVTRVGNLKNVCNVNYATESGSAVEGESFRGQAGQLTFLPGEELKTIQIPIIDDEGWNATLEFSVTLSKAKGCILGKEMSRARVKIIDNDVFPTNRIKYTLQDDRIIREALSIYS